MDNTYLSPGSLLANRFEIERAAGSGGMGTVYRARDHYSGDVVALKLLRSEAKSPADAERFAREALLLSELRHPAIVTYVAHGQTPDGQHFLAMEWLAGHDLGQHLTSGPLSIRDALLLVRRIAEALQVAHGHGIVHRDLKPTNIFLPDGDIARCKLLDFGIARRLSSKAMTRTGIVMGTPEYMAPEQARCARELSPAVDIFSLGCIFYECLTGEPPFIAEHIAAVLMRILFEEPTPISNRRPGVPGPVVALLSTMLQKDPGHRIADATALLGRLDQLGELPAVPAVPTLAEPGKPPSQFAAHEQILYSLVLAAAPKPELPLADTEPSPVASTQRAALLSAIESLGARSEQLLNGTLVVRVQQTGSAQDQAAMAARVGLLIKERWPQATVVVTTGRGASQGTTAVGEVADRAVEILERRRGADSAARPDSGSSVWLDELSVRLLGPRFATVQADMGWLLLGEEKEVDESRTLLGKPTPCIGRDTELAILEAQLNGCIEDSQARVVLITAPAGVGKSRLRHEFLRRLEKRTEPLTVLLGRGDMMSAGAPYKIISHAIRRLCGLVGAESIETQRQRLRARIAEHLPAAARERVVLFIGELCNIPFPEVGNPMLQAARPDPKIMHDRMRRALLDWLTAECAVAPVLFCLDDLQWGDELTVSLLDEALREQAGSPLFVLSFARPEVSTTFPDLWRIHRVQKLPLNGLSKKACERLIAQVLGKDVPPDVVVRAVEQASGNALFLEELIRAIAESKSEAQPDTVLAMLQARIGRLDSGARRAVRAAAIFGQTFWQGGVAAVLGLPKKDPAVKEWLTAVVSAELVQSHASSRIAEESEYGFRHSLVRDAAYSLLLAADLVSGHRAAGEFLDASGDADAAMIAEHFERSGDKQRASGFYLRAAEKNLEQGNNRDALRHVERGLKSDPSFETTGQLRGVESIALLMLNRYEQIGEPAELAMAQSRPGSLAWSRALSPAFIAALMSQNAKRSFEIVALALATVPDADACVITLHSLSAIQAVLVGMMPLAKLQEIHDKLAEVVAQAEGTNLTIRRYLHASRALLALYCEPRPWIVVTEYHSALKLCEQAGDERLSLPLRACYSEWGWLDLGDIAEVLRRLLALSSQMEKSEDTVSVLAWRLILAWVLAESSEESEWMQAEQIAAALLVRTDSAVLTVAMAHIILARVAQRRGRFKEALISADKAMHFFQFFLHGAIMAGEAKLRALIGLGSYEEAIGVAEQVLAAASRLGSLGFIEVEFRLTVSEVFHAAGNRKRARAELRETIRQIQLRYEDIADPFWKNSYLTRNPSCARALALAKAWELDAIVA